MDYIEVTDFIGVRVAVVEFARAASPLRFVIFPMVHVGEARFYAEVTERLRSCGLVVAEGAPRDTPNARNLMRSYMPIGQTDRLGLVVQKIDYDALGVPVVTPDISAEAFEAGWRAHVPLWQTLTLRVAAPVVGFWQQHFATRRELAWALEASDVVSAEEAATDEVFGGVNEVVVDARDALLNAAVRDVHRERSHEPITVAIVWGAAHMRAVTSELWSLGYRPREAEWMTVFHLDREDERPGW